MITTDQYAKLDEESKEHCAIYGDLVDQAYATRAFFAGAEALARIQSEPSESDEEAAKTFYKEMRDYHDSDGVDVAECFIAGCARYRPLVEEMREHLVQTGHWDYIDAPDRDKLIAQAEALLGKKDE